MDRLVTETPLLRRVQLWIIFRSKNMSQQVLLALQVSAAIIASRRLPQYLLLGIKKSRLTVIFFWLVLLTLLVFIWPMLPNMLAQILILILISSGLWLLRFQRNDLLLLTTIALLLWTVNEWQTRGVLTSLLMTMMIFASITILGLAVEGINHRAYFAREKRLPYWITIALLSAETASLLVYLPITASGRAILVLIIFYYFWQLMRDEAKLTRRLFISHLLFVLFAVILVLGVMIWSGFPRLGTF